MTMEQHTEIRSGGPTGAYEHQVWLKVGNQSFMVGMPSDELHGAAGDACAACGCTEYTLVIYQCRLDSVPQGRDGRWYVGDVKTTHSIRADWLKGFELSSQFTGYAWLVRETIQKPVEGL